MSEIARGAKAAELLEEPLIVEALDGIETEATNRWKSSADPGDRDRLWNLVQAVKLFRTALNKHVTTGKLVSLTPQPGLLRRAAGALLSRG